ncbi:hypothetical protein GCM10009784_10200 [Arthrobacter parietis]|uniref:Uncharacterized protein n=2 Tax=Arthrobacter TaxID=1663 RepID=A0ABT6CS97_9MICC|nr:hypothetical protein [Arthrobacter vasquezii]MDF9276952.1 hypothetical protein [Arthrobacter vasquezii]
MNIPVRHVLAAALGGHIVTTLLAQFPNDAFSRMKSHDFFSLVPSWRFFAPTPARSDYHLFCRGVNDEELSGWVDVHQVGQRRPLQLIWHPEHRTEKGMFDVMADLLRAFPYVDGESIHKLSAYRVLEDYVLSKAESASEIERFDRYQFCIVGSGGYDETIRPSVLFVSRESSRAVQREHQTLRIAA